VCGIAGFSTAGDGKPIPPESDLRRMCATLVHRGPDDDGFLHDGRVGLGMRRLSVIDLAGGRQPIVNEDGTIATVCNGEIYNFRELRAELEAFGHRFRTRSDIEVIVHAYEQWGDGFVSCLNGMFALALYDMANARLLLARDHVGIKPLYYARTADGLFWGSEVKALLASGRVQRDLDVDALGQFLAWEYCPGATTLLTSVRKLLPGHMLTQDLRTGRMRTERYWRLPEGVSRDRGDDDWLEQVDTTLQRCVTRQLVSDVPLGAFLSGGVDSSLITGAMGDAVTFSIGFEDSGYDELAYSKRVAAHLGVRHITEVITPGVLDLFDQLMHFMDDPIGDSSIFPTYLLSKLARQHVTVALSGDGGDELFGGYETYRAQYLSRRLDRLPWGLRRTVLGPVSRLRPARTKKGWLNKVARFAEGAAHDPALGHARWRLFLGESLKSRVFTQEAAAAMTTPVGAHIGRLFDEAGTREPLSRSLYVDLASYLPDDILTKVDRMSMAVSLEARVPFLDKEMVELAFSLPDRLKVRGGVSKWILKRLAERYVPADAVYRPKEGFSAPIKNWIAGPCRGLMDELLSERRIRQEGLFDWPELRRMRNEHVHGRRNHSHQLWAIMMFQAWQDRWLRR
jgi:asparagine synthase (glutamine-hydrolysing)